MAKKIIFSLCNHGISVIKYYKNCCLKCLVWIQNSWIKKGEQINNHVSLHSIFYRSGLQLIKDKLLKHPFIIKRCKNYWMYHNIFLSFNYQDNNSSTVDNELKRQKGITIPLNIYAKIFKIIFIYVARSLKTKLKIHKNIGLSF